MGILNPFSPFYYYTRRTEMRPEGYATCNTCGQPTPAPKKCPTCGQEVKKRKGAWDGWTLRSGGEVIASVVVFLSLANRDKCAVKIFGCNTHDPLHPYDRLWNAYCLTLDDLPPAIREAKRWAENYFNVDVS